MVLCRVVEEENDDELCYGVLKKQELCRGVLEKRDEEMIGAVQ